MGQRWPVFLAGSARLLTAAAAAASQHHRPSTVVVSVHTVEMCLPPHSTCRHVTHMYVLLRQAAQPSPSAACLPTAYCQLTTPFECTTLLCQTTPQHYHYGYGVYLPTLPPTAWQQHNACPDAFEHVWQRMWEENRPTHCKLGGCGHIFPWQFTPVHVIEASLNPFAWPFTVYCASAHSSKGK